MARRKKRLVRVMEGGSLIRVERGVTAGKSLWHRRINALAGSTDDARASCSSHGQHK